MKLLSKKPALSGILGMFNKAKADLESWVTATKAEQKKLKDELALSEIEMRHAEDALKALKPFTTTK